MFEMFSDYINKSIDSASIDAWYDDEWYQTKGVTLLEQFTVDDWSRFVSEIEFKSDTWFEYAIDCLSEFSSSKSKDVIIELTSVSRKAVALYAMEAAQDFIDELTPEIRRKLEKNMRELILLQLK